MKRFIFVLPLLLLLGCGKKTEHNAGDETPIDTYRKGIDRTREVQQKSVERSKTLDSLSQEGQ